MGGNALRQYGAVRIERNQYNVVTNTVTELLKEAFGIKGDSKVYLIPSYRNKTTFGDADYVYPSSYRRSDLNETIRNLIPKYFEIPDGYSYCSKQNGDVLSFGIPLSSSTVFQIDLISVIDRSLDFAKSYFSWNDTGNLIGRIAHKQGLKFGHDGLSLPVRQGTHLFDTLILTTDFKEALEFIGYDYDRWATGFDDIEDIYRYIISNDKFSNDIYSLENRNHIARVRDKKRPVYTGFLLWLDAQNISKHYDYPKDKSEWYPAVFKSFPGIEERYNTILENARVQQLIRDKTNIEEVSKITGLAGKELGHLLSKYKASYGTREQYTKAHIELSSEEIVASIVKFMDDKDDES